MQTKDAFAYRLEGLVFFCADLMAPLLMMVAWKTIFESQPDVAGYTINQILFYYLLIFILRTTLSVYPHDISNQIRTGKLNASLVRPVSILINQLASEIAWKIVRIMFLAVAVVLLVITFFGGVAIPNLQLISLPLLISLVNALLLNYFIKTIIEFTAFWTSEVDGLRSSFYILESFFSGTILPLNLLPGGIEALAQLLPFRFFYYFPIQIMLGKVSNGEIISNILISWGWLLFAIIVTRLLIRRGLKRYSAFSG
ncbi:MAG: hypothetical protein UW69_C0077G0014 [Microgenomates group bacterium GW2011_GWA2_44_7]|nr:MAG: hypothetical protein UW69_C0077G0014 [Microgenomates group bacterium GW2011_GWA2_44_7]